MNNEELEKEIENYLHSIGVGYGGWVDGMEDEDLRKIARHFAEWQKEQMMKEAVEGTIVNACYPTKIETNSFYSKFEHGQKVKLIIIKED